MSQHSPRVQSLAPFALAHGLVTMAEARSHIPANAITSSSRSRRPQRWTWQSGGKHLSPCSTR